MPSDSRFNKFLTIKYFYGVVMSVQNLLIKLGVVGLSAATLLASGTTGASNGSSQSLSQALTSGKTFTGSANGGYYSPATGVQFASGSPKFSIKSNSNGGFDTVLDGESYTFSAADYNSSLLSYVKKISATRTVALAVSPIGDKYKYAGLLGAELIDTAISYQSVGFAGYGVQTETTPTAASVSLNGEASMIIADKTTKVLYAYRGDIGLLANFSTNKISGSIYNLANTVDATKVPGQLNLVNGKITHNVFDADLSASSNMEAYLNTSISGKLQGGFYGPNAAETAGIFSLSTTNSATVGAFIAKQ